VVIQAQVQIGGRGMATGQRWRQAGPAGNGEKESLELRVRQGERLAVEQLPKHRNTRAARSSVERLPQRFGIHEVQRVGLVDHRLELLGRQARSEVDKCAHGTGHRYSAMTREVLTAEPDPPVHHDSWSAAPHADGHGDLDERASSRTNAPQGRGALVAQGGLRAAAEHRRRPHAEPAQLRTANRIDASPHRMEAPAA
jgi:hypothetical protein